MRDVSIVSVGQIPVEKKSSLNLRSMGEAAIAKSLINIDPEQVDALFVGNMLSDELQGQKHLAALIADTAGLFGIEALDVNAAMASGAASLRMAYLAVASGEADLAIAVGVEKMSDGVPTAALAKALDAEKEVADGATMISKNADLLRLYLKHFDSPEDAMENFAVNAHRNAKKNPNALFFGKTVTPRMVRKSRIVHHPLKLMDCSPISDGAAAVVLAPTQEERAFSDKTVRILASSVATDRFSISQRKDPLWLEGAYLSAQKAFRQANVNLNDISLFEVHDAFSIMACLQLEAVGFAKQGEGWLLAKENEIRLNGKIPISTFGGLKGRGHPIGASGLYQASEIYLQLTQQAEKNQIKRPKVAMMQSIGGAATTVISHIFGN